MEGKSIKTFQNLCKIFEMRIRLDAASGDGTSEEVITNYEKYAQKIDSYYNEEFQKELKDLISPKDTLEKERDRLEKLICLLEDRLEKRSKLTGDYYRATGKYIKNLQLIVSEVELNNKKERFGLVSKYLDITKEIASIKESILKLEESLREEETKKEEYLEKNKILEDELYSSFITSVSSDEYYSNIEEEKIIDILNEVIKKSKETEETLDITRKSVESLLATGMNGEYESYIEEASKNYTLWKDREIVLKIYKLVINFEDDFNDILSKRDVIDGLLEERKAINIENDILLSFEDVMYKQREVLNNEKEILENIANYTSRIAFKKDRLSELEESIRQPEILTILSEYNINSSSNDNNDIEEDNTDFATGEDVVLKEYNPYRIVSIDDYPPSLNIMLAKLKGSSVREKVNKKLNPEVLNESSFVFGVIDDNNGVVKEENSSIDETLDNNIDSLEIGNNSFSEVTDNSLFTDSSSGTDSNSFWIPVSDEEAEINEFPNIDTPNTLDNLDSNSSDNVFGFPEVNN